MQYLFSAGSRRMALQGALFLLAVILPVLILFLAVPEQNNYAEATVLKHQRLASVPGRRIILVGGSNLSYGIDSTVLEHETGHPVVNMGMNGWLGVRYMLEEIKPSLHRSDLVVVAFEHDNYFAPADGKAPEYLMILKANPHAFHHLTWKQRLAAGKAIPYVAQQKILRSMRNAINTVWSPFRAGNRPDLGPDGRSQLQNVIESLSGFNKEGDLVSHLQVKWPYELRNGLDLAQWPLNRDTIALINAFGEAMKARGIDVILSYTPVLDDYYQKYQRNIEAIHSEMKKSKGLWVPQPPSTYVYNKSMFFDTVYHLNSRGRSQRSRQLAGDIAQYLNNEVLRAAHPHFSKN